MFYYEFPINVVDVSALTTSTTVRRDHEKALGRPRQSRGGQGHQKNTTLPQHLLKDTGKVYTFFLDPIFEKSDPN